MRIIQDVEMLLPMDLVLMFTNVGFTIPALKVAHPKSILVAALLGLKLKKNVKVACVTKSYP
jgi:hypothetical protein